GRRLRRPGPPGAPRSRPPENRELPRKAGRPARPSLGWVLDHPPPPPEERPMPSKSILALPGLGAAVLVLLASVSPGACSSPTLRAAPGSPPPQSPDVANPLAVPEADQPRTHTLTIYNGDHVMQQTFVRQNGLWRSCGVGKHHGAFFRAGRCDEVLAVHERVC